MNGAASSVKWQPVLPTGSFILNDNDSARPVVTVGSMVDRHSPFYTRSRYFNPVASPVAVIATGGECRANALAGRVASGSWKKSASRNCGGMNSE